MIEKNCPAEEELWPAAVGETIPCVLDSHLANCETCTRRLHSMRSTIRHVRCLPENSKAVPSSSEVIRPQPLSQPPSIGDYHIVSMLASGGQADVYRAWHPRLKIEVVVKWYRAEHIEQSELERIVAEAQMLGSIRHPCLCQVFDVGIDQGRHFLVMEYVSGMTFSDWIRRTRPTYGRMAVVLALVARAIDCVHQRGVLHLDITPGNILINEQGHPTIIDFGMARTHGDRADLSRLSAPSTPEYMAPEQYAGHPNDLGYATDVYGLGAVLYAAICQRPIRTSEQLNLNPDWEPLKNAPLGLQRLCRKALALHPQSRPHSALSVACQLESFARRSQTTHRTGATILALLACLCLGLIFRDWLYHPSPVSLMSADEITFRSSGHVISSANVRSTSPSPLAPSLIVATASTEAFVVPHMNHRLQGSQLVSSLGPAVGQIQTSNAAGPVLILSARLPVSDTRFHLSIRSQLQRCREISIRQPLCFRVSDSRVERVVNHPSSQHASQTEQEQLVEGLVYELQSTLQGQLPRFDGMLRLPATTDKPESACHVAEVNTGRSID